MYIISKNCFKYNQINLIIIKSYILSIAKIKFFRYMQKEFFIMLAFITIQFRFFNLYPFINKVLNHFLLISSLSLAKINKYIYFCFEE